jgi:hypothetical protein
MFNNIYYHGLLRKYVMLVGALFNDIYIRRLDSAGNQTELIKVPLAYSAKDKMLARVLQDPDISRPTAMITLPAMSFEMGEMAYDSERKLNTTGRSMAISPSDADQLQYQYNPVPYDINFKVYAYTKNVEDGTKIMEQVLPYFTPDWTTSVKLIPEMDIAMAIPVILKKVHYDDNYDKAYQERRAIIWTIDLVVKAYLYGPIKKTGVIKLVDVNFYTFPETSDD